MIRNPFRTLRGRLTTTYALLALIGVAASALYTANTLRSGLRDRVGLDLADQARLLASDVSEPLAQGDHTAVEDYVGASATMTHVRFAVVDRGGTVVVTTDSSVPVDAFTLRDALGGNARMVIEPGGQLIDGYDTVRVTVPVTVGEEVVGALEATSTLDELQSIAGRLNATTLLVAIGATLVASVSGFLLATSVARPAGQVAQAALHLANRRPAGLPFGPQTTSAFPARLPEPRGSTDEIRTLVKAFNSLADQLRVHEQARSEFASDVSHELHSLASAMQTAAEALELGAAQANPALAERLIGGLVGHTRRLSRLADDLLELARWEGGRLRVDAQDIDLAELVRGTLDEWTPEARRRGIALQVRLPVGPLPLYGDPIRLTQAFGNLVENALKYAGSNGWVRVDVAPPLMGSYELAVTDSGPGIPLDVLPRVFERYFRVEGRASGGPGGMGLGLAIARAVVLAHGGELTAESPRGSGARFVLRLPVPHVLGNVHRPIVSPELTSARAPT
ncbi:MAG TPA: HAMP domain-containing sensor histidine kinase [Chloroflexota bacterium]|nr:HAMP domain-containing sensor histidine kinase [Chloroflexota bacterium]